MNGTWLRRAFTCSLVLLCASHLPGCATPDVMCGMKIDFTHETQMAETGNVQLAWRFNAPTRTGTYGVTDCFDTETGKMCLVRLKIPPPKFSDVCSLAKFGHEVAHVGSTHNY